MENIGAQLVVQACTKIFETFRGLAVKYKELYCEILLGINDHFFSPINTDLQIGTFAACKKT